jgi:hypothetical protein
MRHEPVGGPPVAAMCQFLTERVHVACLPCVTFPVRCAQRPTCVQVTCVEQSTDTARQPVTCLTSSRPGRAGQAALLSALQQLAGAAAFGAHHSQGQRQQANAWRMRWHNQTTKTSNAASQVSTRHCTAVLQHVITDSHGIVLALLHRVSKASPPWALQSNHVSMTVAHMPPCMLCHSTMYALRKLHVCTDQQNYTATQSKSMHQRWQCSAEMQQLHWCQST